MRFMVWLFAANVIAAVWIWIDIRQIKPAPEYELYEYAKEVAVLKRGDVATGIRRCMLLGPFENEERANVFQDVLKERRLPFERVEQSLEKAPTYWVYFGPLPDYDSAVAQLREFQSKNIDSFIITREDLYGAISVGVFENIDSARRMQVQMTRKGYPTSIRNIFKYKTVWWYEIRTDQELIKAIKNKQLDGYGRPDFDFREIFCKTVAS